MMKTVLFLFVFSTLGFFAIAQTSEKKVAIKVVRKDLKATKKQRKNRNVDLKAGNTANALNESMEIKKDKKALTKHVKGLKKEGAKHPIKLAGKQIRRTK